MPACSIPAFHLMAKPGGPRCNLACQYCFYLDKGGPVPGSRFRMSDEVLEEYIRQTIEAHCIPEVTFAWQGGEPTLLGRDFFEKALALQKKYSRPGMVIHNTIQTNGVLLDDPLVRILQEEPVSGWDQYRRTAGIARCLQDRCFRKRNFRPGDAGACSFKESQG